MLLWTAVAALCLLMVFPVQIILSAPPSEASPVSGNYQHTGAGTHPSSAAPVPAVLFPDNAKNGGEKLGGGTAPLSVSLTLTPTPSTIDGNQSVSFTATVTPSTTCSATIGCEFSVYFGNGNSSSSACTNTNTVTITYTYPDSGYYNASATVTVFSGIGAAVCNGGSTTDSSGKSLIHVNLDTVVKDVAPANPLLDLGQTVNLTGNATFGTPGYSYQWYNAAGNASACTSGTKIPTATKPYYLAKPVASGLAYYCYAVTDSVKYVASSPWDPVVTNSALTAPVAPSVNATKLDTNQSFLAQSSIPSTGTPKYKYVWLESFNGGTYTLASQCQTPSGSNVTALTAVSCNIPSGTLVPGTYAFVLNVTDNATLPESTQSAASPMVNVTAALTSPGAPTVSATRLDSNQTLFVNSSSPSTGTSPYNYSWLVSVNGGAPTLASQCASDTGRVTTGGKFSCVVAPGTLSPGTTYVFYDQLNDSANTTEQYVSAASASVLVASALSTPKTPLDTAHNLDANQELWVNDSLPAHGAAGNGTAPYSYEWLMALNASLSFSKAVVCQTSGGSGAAAGSSVSCAILPGTLAAGTNYSFELQLNDSATSPERSVSAPSSIVHVFAPLAVPITPIASAAAVDWGQALDLVDPIAPGGVAPYHYAWRVSVNGGTFSLASLCAVPSGLLSGTGINVTCAIAPVNLTIGSTYAFELWINDSASRPANATSPSTVSIPVSAPPAAHDPLPLQSVIDLGENLTLTANVSGGTGPLSYQWYSAASSNVTACASATPISGATNSTYLFAPTKSSFYCYVVKDSATTPEVATSPVANVTVDPALVAPAATPAKVVLDSGQSLTLTATPSGGTPPYTIRWYFQSQGLSCASGTAVPGGSGPGLSVTPSGTGSYCYAVNDSTSSPHRVFSAPDLVTVNPTLSAPAAPSPSSNVLDVGQSFSVKATLPTTGTAPYAYEWLVSVNAGAFSKAMLCATPSGTGAVAGAPESCSVAPSELQGSSKYAFEVVVNDSATTSESVTSTKSVAVQVNLSPSVTEVTANPSTVAFGASTRINVSVSGGTTPYSYLYARLPSGCVTANSPELNCTPQAAGTFSIKVTVTDSKGESATGSVLLTVTAKPGSSGHTNSSTPSSWLSGELLWVLVGVVVVIAILALLLLTRRRSGGASVPPAAKEGNEGAGVGKSDEKPSKPEWSEESEPGSKTEESPAGTEPREPGPKPEG